MRSSQADSRPGPQEQHCYQSSVHHSRPQQNKQTTTRWSRTILTAPVHSHNTSNTSVPNGPPFSYSYTRRTHGHSTKNSVHGTYCSTTKLQLCRWQVMLRLKCRQTGSTNTNTNTGESIKCKCQSSTEQQRSSQISYIGTQ